MNRFVTKILGVEKEIEEDCLGLYISPTDIFIAQTTRKNNNTVIEGLIRVAVPPFDKSILKPLDLNENFFTNSEIWLTPLKNIMEKKKWKTKRVVVSLSSSFSILRHFVMPDIERKYWKQSIPLQARKYIHYPFEKGSYSYYVYNVETAITKQKKLGVVFAMTGKKIVDSIKDGLKNIGYEAIAIELSAFSVERAYHAMDKEAVEGKGRIYSFFGVDTAELLFVNGNVPLLLRGLDISGPLPIERRRLEISNYTDFISKQLERDPFEEAVIMGHNTYEWTHVLEADARKPVRFWNMKEGLGIEPKTIGEVSAIGACSKFIDDTLPDVDVSGKKRINKQEVSAVLTMWKIAIFAVICFIGLNIWGKYQVIQVNEALKKAQQSAIHNVDFAGMDAGSILSLSESMERKITEYNKVLNSFTFTPVFEALAKITPPEIWISKFTYREPYSIKDGAQPPNIEMEGYISSPQGEWKYDIDLGNKFKDLIASAPAFAPMCKAGPGNKGVEISFPVETNVSGGGGIESKGTRFILRCQNQAGARR
ncbi:Putatively involved in type II secretion system [Elusimicrobium minutum Pei191]|uniref:Putatively involved in type II secretion system n=1 Tax=Elusimicrobium minutum (strain Pei191) TaxID=445932 RepID=B2KC03_ELUMP|nr:pilus assembly protein PilM [Elusimicrobium minutum]ACC98130.1 Putatively involved in type II secretion system [Elusimicrobium minutum Pei191]